MEQCSSPRPREPHIRRQHQHNYAQLSAERQRQQAPRAPCPLTLRLAGTGSHQCQEIGAERLTLQAYASLTVRVSWRLRFSTLPLP